MRRSFPSVVLAVIVLLIAACSHAPQPPASQPAFVPYDPYIVPPAANDQAENQAAQVREGMDEADVLRVMGQPNQVKREYDPRLGHAMFAGKSFWYLNEEPVFWGNQDTHGQTWVKITLDADDVVKSVEKGIKYKN